MDNGLPKELSDGGAEEAGKGRTIDGKPLEDNREQISNIVGWNGPNDPENPQNWPFWRKATITFCVAIVTFFVTFASSVLSPATVLLSKEYGVSVEVTTFSTSLFVLGLAFGPLFWGPASEIYGRRLPLFSGFAIFVIFQIPVAVARNLETILLSRFLAGVFGAAPLSCVGGQMVDIWDPVARGIGTSCFLITTFAGPLLGPVIGGFIVINENLGWRWTAWITLIISASGGLVCFLLVPETFAPVILRDRARRLRVTTKDWAKHALIEEMETTFGTRLMQTLSKVPIMLISEPILVLMTLYISVVYGTVFLLFESYPISFEEVRGWNVAIGALPFLANNIGVFLGGAYIIYTTKTTYQRKFLRDGKIDPEARLVPMVVGGVLLPIGLFWFAWTSNPHITWVPQVLSGIPIGAGIFIINIQGYMYVIDAYIPHANSVVAAVTIIRSLFGAGFPQFTAAMYHKLGVAWASTLLAFLTAAMVPVPVLFLIYGKRIRSISKFSPLQLPD